MVHQQWRFKSKIKCTATSEYIGFSVKGLGLICIYIYMYTHRHFGVSKRTPFLKSPSQGLQYKRFLLAPLIIEIPTCNGGICVVYRESHMNPLPNSPLSTSDFTK